jgi:hypothetical protein
MILVGHIIGSASLPTEGTTEGTTEDCRLDSDLPFFEECCEQAKNSEAAKASVK